MIRASVSVMGIRAATHPARALGRRWTCVFALAGLWLVGAPAASAALSCRSGGATGSVVGRPTSKVAWRAELLGPTGVFGGISDARSKARISVGPAQATWLLVLGAARADGGRCWVRVRLPWRPNDASGWVDASRLILRPTAWRIVVSVARRSLTVYRGEGLVRRVRVVVGAHSTPTPLGLFSIIGAWRSPPTAFLGSWILPLTAHSTALHEFDGGDGTIGIHGRGGASLLDPLGSARSHGCIRLDNSAIDWLVSRIGARALSGIPVWVT